MTTQHIVQDGDIPRHKLKTTLQDENKEPVVLLACGSFSPITFLHLRLFEAARDQLHQTGRYEVLAGYISPVNDAYGKKDLALGIDRVKMCELAVEHGASSWISVDARVMERFDRCLNRAGGVPVNTSTDNSDMRRIRVLMLAGADLINSMNVPDLWSIEDMHIILGKFGCVVTERQGTDIWQVLLHNDVLFQYQRNIHVIRQVVQNDVSSTKIRLLLRRGMSIKYLLPDAVIEYIETNKLFTSNH
ncbi:hypothetical protein BDF22DRAFT_726683 [Syncephalis plumigaleata]|nr:hypothetical protein BDF22DRAFT_726683 [Syncephalis plumigaleata]